MVLNETHTTGFRVLPILSNDCVLLCGLFFSSAIRFYHRQKCEVSITFARKNKPNHCVLQTHNVLICLWQNINYTVLNSPINGVMITASNIFNLSKATIYRKRNTYTYIRSSVLSSFFAFLQMDTHCQLSFPVINYNNNNYRLPIILVLLFTITKAHAYFAWIIQLYRMNYLIRLKPRRSTTGFLWGNCPIMIHLNRV